MNTLGSETYENAHQENEKDTPEKHRAQERPEACYHSRSFGLIFPFVPENGEMQNLLNHKIPLAFCKKDYSVANSKATRRHILLEGDNILSLNVLSNTHRNKVDVIYIDPPYNTGNKDFTYNDHYVDKQDTFKHSKWLSFMKTRLELAHELLKQDGFIAISIDDNEYAYLKLLCDQIFGESNLVASMAWKSRAAANDAQHIAVLTEHILIYAKSKANLVIAQSRVSEKGYTLKDEFFEERGGYDLDAHDSSSTSYSKTMDFPLEIDGATYYAGGVTKEEWEHRQTLDLSGKKGAPKWIWGKEQTEFGLKNGFLVVRNGRVLHKRYYKVNRKLQPEIKTVPFNNVILSSEFTSRAGTLDMQKVFGSKVFSYPKPVSLVSYLVSFHPNKDATVLDFFAGSGTTGQAVLELNRQDGGNRVFVLATNNFEQDGVENGIARGVTAERIRRVIRGERAQATPEQNQPFTQDALDYYVVTSKTVNDLGVINPKDWAGVLEISHNANPELTTIGDSHVTVENNDEVCVLFTDADSVELEDDIVHETMSHVMDSNKDVLVYVAGETDNSVDIEVTDSIGAHELFIAWKYPQLYVSTIYSNVERMKHP